MEDIDVGALEAEVAQLSVEDQHKLLLTARTQQRKTQIRARERNRMDQKRRAAHLKILEVSFRANGGDYEQLLVDARTQAEAEISAQK